MSVAKRIIPCLDVDKGRVVKGVNFVNIKDAGDPVEIAKRYDDQGADELTMLDITASSETREITYKTVESIAGQVFIPLTVGGGVRNTQDIKRLLRSGADKVSINTAAVENPDFIKEASDKFGSQCIVVAVDAKSIDDTFTSWEVVTYGGRKRTGIDVIEWVQNAKDYGAGEILLTSMDRDGTKEGFDNKLTRSVSSSISIPINPLKNASTTRATITNPAIPRINAMLVESVVGSPLEIGVTSVFWPAYENSGIEDSPLILEAGTPSSQVPSS